MSVPSDARGAERCRRLAGTSETIGVESYNACAHVPDREEEDSAVERSGGKLNVDWL